MLVVVYDVYQIKVISTSFVDSFVRHTRIFIKQMILLAMIIRPHTCLVKRKDVVIVVQFISAN